MSALDQAVIKAYAKGGRAVESPATLEASTRPVATAAPAVRAQTVEQIYHEGALYRVEAPLSGTQKRERTIPTPHLAMLPPTSPRRAVRRSMIKMLSANAGTANTEPAVDAPRVARKVIIRHISHSVAPPLGMLRPSRNGAFAELPPETITNEPNPSTPNEPSPLPPQIAPLNIAIHGIESIDVCGDWDHEAAVAPMVLVADVRPRDALSTVVNVQLPSLDAVQADSPPTSAFNAKSLDDGDETQSYVRLDGSHAREGYRSHARFGRSGEAPRLSEAAAVADIADELTFAEAEALASDLIPASTGEAQPDPIGKPIGASKVAVPQWEIDKFHWPRTCEKLFADEQGYLAKAGDKLQAAMQDGLKVLAITGSRRGEGRSTLALCLARAAAKAGIQTAVMDADFARPQLASKVGLEIAHGWQEAALGTIPLSEAAVKSIADQITLLPLESSAATRVLSLADPRVTATIRAASATFELLILDLGPLGAGAEVAFPPGENCPLDAAIVVRDLRFATAAESEAIGHTLQDAGVEAVGIAENFVIEDDIPATSA